MRIADTVTVPAAREEVWAAILDGEVLARAIPGCERLVATGEHDYDLTVTAGVASIRGTYDGRCRLFDLDEQESLTMRLTGAGAPGTVDATVQVRLSDVEGGTAIAYDADAVVGGMVGGVGQRMLASASKRLAREFFAGLGAAMRPQAPEPGEARQGGVVHTAPASATRPMAGTDFLAGVAVGGALVAIGVLVGRRR